MKTSLEIQVSHKISTFRGKTKVRDVPT